MNLFGKTVVSMAVLLAFDGVNAAQNGRVSMMAGATAARMPVMPVVSLNTIGNPAVQTVNNPLPGGGSHIVPHINPDNPDNPDPTPSNCPDGGVRNSQYTIDMCMNDILSCVNNGGLTGGINGLFNADVRNSIMTGMMLCQSAVDKCVKEVRVNCRNIYNETPDVWLDFNSRVIQPEYYNFVLRRTGLTPNQAENTCLLLDRNTYGESFAAVSDTDAVNTEYEQRVGAYNEAKGGKLSKANPQGAEINTVGYDGNRGHYARWDASSAECLVRVAAYNKDKLITNSWLFGAAGDNTPAEVWEKAGSSFTCNKELFDFKSLLNDTKTTAVIAVPGGAVVGAAIGAGAGAGAYDKKLKEIANQCKDKDYRRELGAKIISSKQGEVLKNYLYGEMTESDGQISGNQIFGKDTDFSQLSEEQCVKLYNLAERLTLYKSTVADCLNTFPVSSKTFQGVQQAKKINNMYSVSQVVYQNGYCVIGNASTNCSGVTETSETEGSANASAYTNGCLFKPLYLSGNNSVLCNGENGGCLDVADIQVQMQKIESLLSGMGLKYGSVSDISKGKEIGKGAAIGAATGAGAGALATAITALVERNHITCKVGDGLNTVSLGKSHSIDSLKDFYVKWNLNLPDSLTPTAVVTDWQSWDQACGQFKSRLMDCEKVTINLKTKNPAGIDIYTNVSSACKRLGTSCMGNRAVMNSNGFPVYEEINVTE